MIRFISEEAMEKLHRKSLELLENVGVEIQHEAVLTRLARAGAKVDQAGFRARLPGGLVEECLGHVPREYVLAARNPKHDIRFPLPENEFITRTNTGAPHFVEPLTYQLRDVVTLAQQADFTRLSDALENVDYIASPFIGDAPLQTTGLYALKSMFENTGKHLWIQPYHEDTLPYLVEMVAAVAGGKDEIRKRPVAHITVGSVSPLRFKYMDTEALRLCGEYGLPVTIYALPSMGGTAPLSIGGINLLTNCELLAGNVVVQVCHPGTPVHFLGHKFMIDMASGAARHSAVETMMAAAAHGEFSIRKYGIPFHTYGSGSDSFLPDGQSMIDRTFQGLLAGLGEVKVFGGVGQLETVNAISPTQLVIDNDILGMIRKVRRGINWDDDNLAAEVIAQVGPGGEFMTHDHTYRHCRDAFRTKTFNRMSRAEWLAEGKGRTILENADDLVDELLKSHEVTPLPADAARALAEILNHANKKLGA
ncbi:MAG: trimethylamine methyltransferase family protein [Thermodesulfobacteriota bacterium]